jgi:hypothetical protein
LRFSTLWYFIAGALYRTLENFVHQVSFKTFSGRLFIVAGLPAMLTLTLPLQLEDLKEAIYE